MSTLLPRRSKPRKNMIPYGAISLSRIFTSPYRRSTTALYVKAGSRSYRGSSRSQELGVPHYVARRGLCTLPNRFSARAALGIPCVDHGFTRGLRSVRLRAGQIREPIGRGSKYHRCSLTLRANPFIEAGTRAIRTQVRIRPGGPVFQHLATLHGPSLVEDHTLNPARPPVILAVITLS